MYTQRYIILALAAGVGWASVAMAQNEKEPAMPTITQTSKPGTGGSGTFVSDANIVALLNEANVADSAAGAMALPKATRSDVKDFAREMIGDHHGLHVETEQVAKAQHITPTMPPSDPFTSALSSETQALTSTPQGRAFDSTYVAQEVTIHKAVIAWAGTAATDAQSSALEDLIKKARPVLHRHLDRAEAIQKAMKTGTTASR